MPRYNPNDSAPDYSSPPDLTPVSMADPSGGTLPSTNPSAGITQPSQAPFIDPSVVNPMGTIGGVPTNPDASPDDFIKRRMGELYTPEHSASDKFNALLAAYPQREKPGLMRSIIAGMYGLGAGPEGAQKILDEPFNEKLTDWSNQIKYTDQAANLERYTNANERSFANQEVQRELQDQEIKRKEKKDAATEDYQQGSLKARLARTEFMYYKQQHPNHVLQTDNEGYVYAVNPQDNSVDYLQDADGDMIEASKLPEAMRLQIQHQNKVGEIQATGTQRVKEIDETGSQQRQTNQAKPATGANNPNKPLSAREIAGQRKNRVADLIAADPENSKYIKTDPNTGAIMLQAPGGTFSSPTPEQLAHVKVLRDYIYGPEVGQPSASHPQTPMNQNPLAQGQNTLPPPEKRVVGQTYTMGNGKPGIWSKDPVTGNYGFKPAGVQ